jgi:hypothetical protein
MGSAACFESFYPPKQSPENYTKHSLYLFQRQLQASRDERLLLAVLCRSWFQRVLVKSDAIAGQNEYK